MLTCIKPRRPGGSIAGWAEGALLDQAGDATEDQLKAERNAISVVGASVTRMVTAAMP